MDIPREKKSMKGRRAAIVASVALGLGLATWALARLEPAAPTVDRATLWIDAASRGPFVREVRGHGTLVPENIRWISAGTSGRVERLLVAPGARVEPDTILLEMGNFELETRAREAELAARAAQADLEALRARLQRDLLDQEAVAATVSADAMEAKLQADANEELAREGLVSDLLNKISRVRADETATRLRLEERRLAGAAVAVAAEEAAQAARVGQMRELAALRRDEVEGLRVRAGMAGVLQSIAVEPGQQVAAGMAMARVADPGRLKAELRVPETLARDVAIGLPALVDTRNGKVTGKVSRIDPAVIEGTVLVDIALDGELPKGSRPDLSVDGTIEIERLDDALSVTRPPSGQAQSKASLFKVNAEGTYADRVQVLYGRGSVHRIEVLEGLAPGDKVILSDMSSWDEVDRVRLQ